jgi:hypothetical protein
MWVFKNIFFIMPLFVASILSGRVSEAQRQQHKLEVLIERLENIKIEPEPEVPLYALRRHYFVHDRFEPFLTSAYDFRSVISDVKDMIISLIRTEIDIEDVVIRLCLVVDTINHYDKQMKMLIRHYEDFVVCIKMMRDIYDYSRVQRNATLDVLENEAVMNIRESLLFNISDKLYVPFTNNDVLTFASS